MGAGESTKLIVVEESMAAIVVSELLEGVFKAVEVVIVQQAQDLGVEARDHVMARDYVDEPWGTGLVGEAQDLVTVLALRVVGDAEADDDADARSVLVLVPFTFFGGDPVEGCRKPRDKPGDVGLCGQDYKK